MKKIEAIIRQEKLEEVKNQLLTHTSVKGMTVHQVLGYGHQLGWAEQVRGQEIIPTLVPKVQLSLVVTNEDLDKVIQNIIDCCQTQELGDGKIFVYDIEDVIRIRTGERREDAI